MAQMADEITLGIDDKLPADVSVGASGSFPFVSVIIPNYNGEEVIRQCLKSVYGCSYPCFEVIIVDDNSRDDSPLIIRKEFPSAVIISNRRSRGFSASVNSGVRAARGSIIAILNMDTVVKKDWLLELVKTLVRVPGTGIAGSKMLDMDGVTIQHAGGTINKNGISSHIGRGEPDSGQYDLTRDVDYVCGASMAFRKELFVEAGCFDAEFYPAYYEDTDLAYRLRRKGYKIIYSPKSALLHRENYSSGKFSVLFYFRYHKSRLRFMFKNFPPGYLLGVFLSSEMMWIRETAGRQERIQLARAYLYNIPYFLKSVFLKAARGGVI